MADLTPEQVMNPTSEQRLWAHCRPIEQRTALPHVGYVVGYRHDPCGPVERAVVTQEPDMATEDDPHTHYVITDWATRKPALDALGRRRYALVEDPWPTVRLQTTSHGVIETREARLPGSPGWLEDSR
jgi:hypothetical protein